MLTECRYCKATVDAEVVAQYDTWDEEMAIPNRYTFGKCPACRAPLLLVQEQYGDVWDRPVRIFPAREDRVSWIVPKGIAKAFSEAARCLNSKSPTASAIMCRKTLEGVCADHGASGRTLDAKLKSLKEAEVIEGRLFEWANELRLVGNEAAHDVAVEVNPQDAADTLEFTRAVLEYVYTFRHRFEEFRKRRQAQREQRASKPKKATASKKKPSGKSKRSPSPEGK